jgi:hypothetical protein
MSNRDTDDVKQSIANARKNIKKPRGPKVGMNKEAKELRQLQVADTAYKLANKGERITYSKISSELGIHPSIVAQIMKSKSFEEMTQFMGMDDFSIAALISNHIYNPDANISLKAIQERNKMVGAYKGLNITLDVPEEIKMMREILNPQIIEAEFEEEDNNNNTDDQDN